MASEINSVDINEAYPVAGQDNDSQGFRDNFRLIKNGLATASTEITNLQTNTAKLDETNDFNGNIISEAKFIKNTEEVYVSDEIQSSQDISWENGHYQIITVGANVTLTLTGWPTSGVLGKMRLLLKRDTEIRSVTFGVSGGGTLKVNSAWPSSSATISINGQTDPTIIDFWTSDGGLTVYGQFFDVFNEPSPS